MIAKPVTICLLLMLCACPTGAAMTQAESEAWAATLRQAGNTMQTIGNQQQQYQLPRPTNCITTVIGNYAYTTCN